MTDDEAYRLALETLRHEKNELTERVGGCWDRRPRIAYLGEAIEVFERKIRESHEAYR